MGVNTPRKAKVYITYTPKGAAATRTADTMAEYEEGFSYIDAATGQSDTISLIVRWYLLYSFSVRWLSWKIA